MRGRERKKERKRKRLFGAHVYMRVYFFHGLVLIHRSHYLARIFRLLGPIPRLSPLHPLSHSRQAIKILSATLLKNYGPLSSASTLDSPRYSLSLTTIEYEHIELSLFISTSLHHSISSGSCLSALCPCRAAASTIRLLFRYSLLGSLFPL